MTLQPGATLGAYRITAQIGVGGMGEVYRASDARLGRDVAIKVLPSEWVADRDRMARFHREAQVLASLNHPHIAAIYGFEESTAAHALVMELVEGVTLADRIQASPTGLPIEDVLNIAGQITQALEYAHERGIVHRDLKPANIKITPDGQVKVLDFGLAKALDQGSGIGDQGSPERANSPTLSLAATAAGMILGTAAYMAPEQAKGKAVDRRADIWASGVIVYEMLTGRMAFVGETASETMAFVMTREPEWSALPAETPVRLRELLRRCLVKDPRSRARDIGDLRIAIEEIASGEPPLVIGLTPGPAPTITGTRLGRVLPWAIAVVSLAAAGMALWAPGSSAPPPTPTVRLNVNLGDDAVILGTMTSPASLAMSPDGTILALVAGKNVDSARLYVRRLDALQATPLAGTEGARNPFFSPDGQWIGFFAAAKLKKIAVTGGAVVTIADAPVNGGGTWTEDGSIIFSPTQQSVLMRVAEGGGTPQPLTKVADGETAHRWPQVLPGGRAVIFTATTGAPGRIGRVVAQRLPDGETKVLQPNGFFGKYLATGPGSPTRGDGGGHLVYMAGSTMFAAPFDREKLEWLGVPVPVLDGVSSSRFSMAAAVSVSNTGALVYVPGGSRLPPRQMVWLDRDGGQSPLPAAAAIFSDPRVSPDGRRIAVSIDAEGSTDIWIYEWARDAMSRLTFDPGGDLDPLWADASHVVFQRQSRQGRQLLQQRADGTGEAKVLVEGQPLAPMSWHPSGKFMAAHDAGRPNSPDLFILPLTGDASSGWQAGAPVAFLATPFDESEPAFSPDGRWLAYQSNETGRFEVYVRSFPGPGGRWQVSTAGGEMPTWSPKGNELLFRLDRQVMVAEYSATRDGSFNVSAPRRWSETRLTELNSSQRNFDIHPDGQRVLAVISPQGDAARPEVVYVSNFFDELRRLAPAKK
jgi:Tol biopolymer transport system component